MSMLRATALFPTLARQLRTVCVLIVLGVVNCTLVKADPAFTLDTLESLLQTHRPANVDYEEVRQSPWLQAPIISRGVMESRPPVLIKQAHHPKAESWRMHPDYLEWSTSDGSQDKTIYFSQAPQVAELSNAIRNLVTGNLRQLAHDFNAELTGHPASWHVRLTPKTDETRRYLKRIEFNGANARVNRFTITEPGGDTTTTTLLHSQND